MEAVNRSEMSFWLDITTISHTYGLGHIAAAGDNISLSHDFDSFYRPIIVSRHPSSACVISIAYMTVERKIDR